MNRVTASVFCMRKAQLIIGAVPARGRPSLVCRSGLFIPRFPNLRSYGVVDRNNPDVASKPAVPTKLNDPTAAEVLQPSWVHPDPAWHRGLREDSDHLRSE